MRINLNLYGDLKKYAPGDQTNFELTLEPGATLGDVLRMLSIPQDIHILLINGRRATRDTRLEEGDTLVLLPPISGG